MVAPEHNWPYRFATIANKFLVHAILLHGNNKYFDIGITCSFFMYFDSFIGLLYSSHLLYNQYRNALPNNVGIFIFVFPLVLILL